MNWNMDADKIETAWNYLAQLAVHQGMNCIAALLILFAGWWLSARAAAAVQRTLGRTHGTRPCGRCWPTRSSG
ncbi:mechanosensitive ion channel family protein [Cupriavidus basilensis]